jgi:hypothetical protein
MIKHRSSNLTSRLVLHYCISLIQDAINIVTSCVSLFTVQHRLRLLNTTCYSYISPTLVVFTGLDLIEKIKEIAYTFSDFYGLPSNPISVYKTGDPWPIPKGPEAQRETCGPS